MRTNQIHMCLELPEAPAPDAEFEDGTRWVCPCGAHYVYREGFNRAGYREMSWWPAPAIAVPRQRQAPRSLKDRLLHPRQPQL